jgi:polysaccharide chain length determinant protein (PEP-CTERM system associated)
METLREIIGRYGGLAWRRRWWGVAAAWVICIAGWVGVSTLPNQFESNARVYIDADAFLTPLLKGIAVESSLEDELDLLQHMLLSRPNLERIISKTDLQLEAATPTDTERLVERLGERIKVVAQTRNIFSITYRNQKPQLASDVVQAVLASFIENKAGDNRDEIDRATVFLDSQIGNYERQLRDAEARRAAFKKKYVDLLPGDSGVNRLEMARTQLKLLTGQLADAKARRILIANQLANTQASFGAGGGPANDPQASLREAEAKLRELKQVYTDQYPEVITQQRLVDSLRTTPPKQATIVDSNGHEHSESNPVFEQFKLQVVETDAQIESVQRQIADATAEVDRLESIAKGVPELEAQYINLNRDYDVVRKNYDELVARREGMRISDAAQKKASNIKLVIIDPPTVPRLPVAPNRILLSFGVLLAGLGAGAGVVGAMIAFDQSFHTLTDLRAMGLPVIGSVSLAVLPPTIWFRLKQIGTFGGALALLALVLGGVLLHFAQPA